MRIDKNRDDDMILRVDKYSKQLSMFPEDTTIIISNKIIESSIKDLQNSVDD